MSIIIKSGTSTDTANVDTSKNLMVNTPGYDSAGVSRGGGPENAGSIAFFSENDAGTATGERYVYSPETDEDYRLRTAIDNMLDTETFIYGAQNSGKHTLVVSTLSAGFSAAGLRTNSAANTAAGGVTFGTYAEFPIFGANNLYCEFEASFDAQPASNVTIDFGMFRRGGATPFAPTDGIYFRLSAAGFTGVINYNGTETQTGVFPFTYVNNQKYQFIVTINQRAVHFWIDEVLQGELQTPVGQSQPCLSATLPLSIRHGHASAAGAAVSMYVNNYNVSIGGVNLSRELGELGNAMFGSYQGLSGGTMGSLSVYTNSTNPTAAVPSNTALTANLPSGLGGQAWESFSTGLAANVDGILMSYQVPAGTVAVQGKRLKLTSVKMSAFIQTALTGGGFNSTFTLAFGHTAVALNTAESATTKARRIVLLPELTQAVTSGQAINTLVSQQAFETRFENPVYVNPGEFIAFCVKHIGTVASAGTIAYNIQFDYSWE